jgi:hypothetical protein
MDRAGWSPSSAGIVPFLMRVGLFAAFETRKARSGQPDVSKVIRADSSSTIIVAFLQCSSCIYTPIVIGLEVWAFKSQLDLLSENLHNRGSTLGSGLRGLMGGKFLFPSVQSVIGIS